MDRSVPAGTGNIWLDNVYCSGDELNLFECEHIGWGWHNCGHSEDIGCTCGE